MTFLVVYQDPTGRPMGVPADRELTVECSKAGNSPLLAYPAGVPGEETGGLPPGLLRPAGALYPLDLDTGSPEPTIHLTWQEGPLAVLVSRLAAIGMDIPLLNTVRLKERFELQEDPWNLDVDSMATELASGKFTAYDVDCLPLREVSLASSPGRWFRESPLSAPVDASESGELTLTQISSGSHNLFSTGGTWIRLYVWEKEVTVVRQR